MIPFKRNLLSAAVILVTLGGCGGGGGSTASTVQPPPSSTDNTVDANDDSTNTVSASGRIVLGSISSFGSIFVNGVEYETDDAEIFRDGQPSTEDQLGTGMVVFVEGEVDDNGTTGTAKTVIVNDVLKGPISAIVTTPDGDAKQLTILGVDVIIERTATVYSDTEFDALAVDDVVEVSGFPETGNNLRATRIEKTSTFVAGESEIELTGTVSNVTATTFTLGDYVVEYSSADLAELGVDALSDGLRVEIAGTLNGDQITASEVKAEDSLATRAPLDAELSVEGTVTGLNGNVFVINGVTVDASAITIEPAGATLANGTQLEVEGTWNGETLVAEKIELRRGRVEVEASIEAIDTESGELTLSVGNDTVVVKVDSRTLLDDDTKQTERLTLGDLNVGDAIEVEGFVTEGSLVATRLDRDDPEESIVVQGPVEAFTPGVDVTILGVVYSVGDTEFENLRGDSVSVDEFFAALTVGDIVKIETSTIAPGTASSIEFESENQLDGGVEFDDSDDLSDDSDDSDDASDDSDDSDDASDDSDDSDDVSDDSDDSDDASDDSDDSDDVSDDSDDSDDVSDDSDDSDDLSDDSDDSDDLSDDSDDSDDMSDDSADSDDASDDL